MADKRWIGGVSTAATAINQAANWSPSGVPTGSDNIYITDASTNSILVNLTTLSTVTGELHVQKGFTRQIGSSTAGYFEMKPSAAFIYTTIRAYIDCKASTGVVEVRQAPSGTATDVGLYVKGTALAKLTVAAGNVGLAYKAGDAAAVTKLYAQGGTLTTGTGATYNTAVASGGRINLRAGTSTCALNVYKGTATLEEGAAMGTISVFNGTCNIGGTGNVTTCNIRGGTVNANYNSQTRTITNLNLHSGKFQYDPDLVTITNFGAADRPIRLTATSI